jgi:dihydrodipicolinate synthase/N-acetylneuraminate lyase
MEAGVYPAAVTPHRTDGHEADFGAMLELVDFLSRFGAKGVCLLGVEGEFLNIRFSDRIRLVHLAVKRSRVPIVAGVSHSTLDGALELASEAISSGAGALLLMPPYFFRYEQADVLEFYRQFAAECGSRLPIILDNNPQFTTPIEFETARELLSSGRFAGIKDAGGHLEQLLDLRQSMPFSLFTSADASWPEVRRHGGIGIMSAASGVVPELFAALERTADPAPIECKIRELAAWIDRFPAPVAVKTAVALRKLKTGPLSVPLPPEKDGMLIEFQRWFPQWLESIKHVS